MKQNNKRKRKRKNNQEVKVQKKREIQKPTEYINIGIICCNCKSKIIFFSNCLSQSRVLLQSLLLLSFYTNYTLLFLGVQTLSHCSSQHFTSSFHMLTVFSSFR